MTVPPLDAWPSTLRPNRMGIAGWDIPVVDAAYALAASRRMCCAEDITLLTEVIGWLPERPLVVQLGAGSGTMGLAVMGASRDAILWSFDIDPQALNWERQVFLNASVKLLHQAAAGYWELRYTPRVKDSAQAGYGWDGRPVDLLIVDADHSYRAVLKDVQAWYPHVSLIFVHDYNGASAPRQYPGVRKACDQLWPGISPVAVGGWSAVFRGNRGEWKG